MITHLPTYQAHFTSLHKKWFLDLFILSGFAVFAALAQFGRTYGYTPVVQLLGDSGQYASIAAALDHLELFALDPVMGDPKIYGWLALSHVFLLRLLAPWSGGYGEAMLAMHGMHVFLFLCGFYLLGVVLTGKRIWGFILALLVIVRVYVGWWMHWGYSADPLPKITYNVALSFLLAAAVYWRGKHSFWPWIMLAAGSLIYVDPPGAIAMGFAIWLGFWARRPDGWSERKRTLFMLLIGGLYLLVTVPYVIIYFSYYDSGSGQGYDLVKDAILFRIHEDFNVGLYRALLVNFPLNIVKAVMPFLGLAAFVGLFFVRNIDRHMLRMLTLWMIGLLFVSVGITLTERFLEQLFNITPVEVELVRNLMFIVPLLMIALVWFCSELEKRLSGFKRLMVAPLVLLVTVAWMQHNHVEQYIASPIRAFKVVAGLASRQEAFPDPEADLRATIVAVQTLTPEHSRFLTMSEDPSVLPQSVRYTALRPLVFNMRDLSLAFISDHKLVSEFLPRGLIVDSLRVLPWDQGKLDTTISLARQWRADYLVVELGTDSGLELKEAQQLYGNKSYQLLKIL